MGDFVGKDEIERIRAHYRSYVADEMLKRDDRVKPISGTYDASTFHEVSSWYINRLLRYIEVMEMIGELERDAK